MLKKLRLSGIHSFGVICFGQSLSQLGTGLTGFALGVWAYQSTGSVTMYALIFFFAVAPRIALMPLIGVMVDRWDRRWAMVASDAAAGLLTLVLVLLFWSGRVEIWHVLIIVSLSSVLGGIQFLAFNSSVALLVPKRHLGRANGLLQLGHSSSLLVAPLLAGALVGRIGVHGVMAIDLVTLACAIATFLIARIPPPQKAPESRQGQGSWVDEALFGWRFIRSRPGLLGLLMLFAVSNLTSGLVHTLVTPLVLAFSNSSMLGRVLSGGSLGMLIGGLLLTVWGGTEKRMTGILAFMAVSGLVLGMGGLKAQVLWIAASAFLYMFCMPLVNGSAMAVWQSKVAPAQQGRVLSVARFVSTASLPAAYLMAGPLVDHVFEPLMAPRGALAGSLGQLIGVGPGRGIGLLFIVMGLGVVAATALASGQASLRHLERDLPDALPDPIPPPQSPQALSSDH